MNKLPHLALIGASLAAFACAGDEAQTFRVTIENTAPVVSMHQVGEISGSLSESNPDQFGPGETRSFIVAAAPGDRVQLLLGLPDSNDAFLAFEPGGAPLWDEDGRAIEGDRTHELVLWDAGTEISGASGAGSGGMQQPFMDGESEAGVISKIGSGEVPGADSGGNLFPAVADVVSLHVEDLGNWSFRFTLENHSTADSSVALSAGVFSVFDAPIHLFDEGAEASIGLELLAEDAIHDALLDQLEARRGHAASLSSIVWAKHDGDLRLYDAGAPASPSLEQFAEDGLTLDLLRDLHDSALADDYGLASPDDAWAFGPGESVEFEIVARPGDRLTLITSYLAGNDVFVGSGRSGIPLFEDGEPTVGDMAAFLEILDAGTEKNEPLGRGPNQYAFQPGPDGGYAEQGLVESGAPESLTAADAVRVSIELVEPGN